MSARMNNTSKVKYDEGRLMQVLVAPIVSEKATMVAFSETMGATSTCIKRPSSKCAGLGPWLMRTSP